MSGCTYSLAKRIQQIENGLSKKVEDTMDNVAQAAMQNVNQLGNGLTQGANQLGNGLTQGANQLGNGLTQGANQLGNSLQIKSEWTNQQIEQIINDCQGEMVDQITDHLEMVFKKKSKQVVWSAVRNAMRKCLIGYLAAGAASSVPSKGFFKSSVQFNETSATVPVTGSKTSCVIDLATLSSIIEKQIEKGLK